MRARGSACRDEKNALKKSPNGARVREISRFAFLRISREQPSQEIVFRFRAKIFEMRYLQNGCSDWYAVFAASLLVHIAAMQDEAKNELVRGL